MNNADEEVVAAGDASEERDGPTPVSASASASASAVKKKYSVPETPRWRFVTQAKKTEGYSSIYAGSVVKGE